MSLRDKITQINRVLRIIYLPTERSSMIIGLICLKVFFVLDVEKQLGVEKDSLVNLRRKIEEAQKQSGRFVS